MLKSRNLVLILFMGFVILVLVGGWISYLMSSPSRECRFFNSILLPILLDSVGREVEKESPNGWVGQPFSQENWNRYWNDRVFYAWDVGPSDCDGTYVGPSGPEIMRMVFGERRARGLPDISLEERNVDKAVLLGMQMEN